MTLGEVKRPDTASVTLLQHAERCRHSAALYLTNDPKTTEMQRGSAFHEVQRRIVEELLAQEETSMPGELAKDFAQAVMDEGGEWDLPAKEQDAVRLMSWNWAEATIVDPATLIGVEVLMSIEIDGWTVRGRIDRLDISGEEAWIRDAKTSLHLPEQEEYEAKLQLPTYALLVAEGSLDGEEIPIGGGVNVFHLYEEYPRFRKDDGTLWNRYQPKTRPELADDKASLRGILGKLEKSFESGDWPATQGYQQCSICPAPHRCPIPEDEREFVPVSSWTEAEAACEQLKALDDRRARIRKATKAWAQANGEIEFGSDLVFGSRVQVSRSIDRDGLLRAADAAAQFGEPFTPEEFVSERPSNRFEIRKREPA